MIDLLIPCLISALIGGVFVGLLALRAVWRLANMVAAAIAERNQLAVELVGYRQAEAERDACIEQEWL